MFGPHQFKFSWFLLSWSPLFICVTLFFGSFKCFCKVKHIICHLGFIFLSFIGQDEAPFQHSGAYNSLRKQSGSNQKAISLPSSPHEYSSKSTERNGDSSRAEDMVLTWNKVLQSSSFLNKPLLPFEEWNIDFSELTVGTRVGIGKLSCSLHLFSDFSFLISMVTSMY